MISVGSTITNIELAASVALFASSMCGFVMNHVFEELSATAYSYLSAFFAATFGATVGPFLVFCHFFERLCWRVSFAQRCYFTILNTVRRGSTLFHIVIILAYKMSALEASVVRIDALDDKMPQ